MCCFDRTDLELQSKPVTFAELSAPSPSGEMLAASVPHGENENLPPSALIPSSHHLCQMSCLLRKRLFGFKSAHWLSTFTPWVPATWLWPPAPRVTPPEYLSLLTAPPPRGSTTDDSHPPFRSPSPVTDVLRTHAQHPREARGCDEAGGQVR